MAPEVGKPGTNFLQVTPEHRKKINSIVKYYRKKPHPFRACVRDNRKRFGPRTEQVCAVVKDMAMGTTKWRKGGKKHLSAQGVPATIDLSVAFSDLVELADELGKLHDRRKVIDLAKPDAVTELAFDESKHPRDPHGRWRALVAKIQGLSKGEHVKTSRTGAFSVHKIADSGPNKYRITMHTGRLTNGRRPDQHITVQTAAEAADVALGISPAQAEEQVRHIRAGRSASERKRKVKLSTPRQPHMIDLARWDGKL